MMENSIRNGAIGEEQPKETGAHESDRIGKAGDAVENHSFTIQPKTAVIEIRGGRVAVSIGEQLEASEST